MTAAHAPKRRLVLAAALASASVGGVLLWLHETRPAGAFEPPAEDICIVQPTRVSQPHPYDPASGLGLLEARPVPPDARCPVCGMYPARFPRWAAQIIFADGATHFFDSPVDLFMFLAEPARFDSARFDSARFDSARFDSARFDSARSGADPAALHVADFDSGRWLDARRAVFVLGSSVRGPMRGPDLPAFADATAAEAFAAANGGRTLHFAEIDPAIVGKLRDANHSHHTH
jgi:copper chaperone NosL